MADAAGGVTVHVAEADGVLALDLCDALERSGYAVQGPFATEAAALTALAHEVPVLAVIGAPFAETSCAALAGVLRRHGVPFVVHAVPAAVDGWLLDARHLARPADIRDLVAALDGLARARARPPSPADLA